MDVNIWNGLLSREQELVKWNRADASVQTFFDQVNTYVKGLHVEIERLRKHASSSNGAEDTGPAAKKRKMDIPNGNSSQPQRPGDWATRAPVLTVPEVSFSVPMRKKMKVELLAGSDGGLRVVDTKTQSLEASMTWDEIEQIITVPVPEKAQPAHNFLLVPRDTAQDTFVLTLPDTPATSFAGAGADPSATQPDAFSSSLAAVSHARCSPVAPSADEFLSALTQPHKSSVKPAHAKAFRGSKDGYLFLLAPGIVWGFRKPVLWFPFDRVVSVSYTSVLQRTFNIVVAARGVEPGRDADEEVEYEFAMLDQADFAGIDAYVKRHGLQDASLADARRAKRYGVNDPRKARGGAAGEAEEEQPVDALKTEQQLQDEEDEEEEDFDPGSEGDSDGSGSDSEEEERERGGGVGGDEMEEEELEFDEEEAGEE
ncbi:hypothetical protein FH972_025873 [Carpinus fangiana]|uniref:Histone chaperone RTT106/FACT complex subunit SPT16-like middle domain-containing protein n=1 Tax=Carpinus fangiana TaxID=176857 RepID=A0A5N6L2J0_9ROSI|nr:hypothetical protein FH972_025873 [Carpinus fangiana]